MVSLVAVGVGSGVAVFSGAEVGVMVGVGVAGAVDRIRERHGFWSVSAARAVGAPRGQIDPDRVGAA